MFLPPTQPDEADDDSELWSDHKGEVFPHLNISNKCGICIIHAQ